VKSTAALAIASCLLGSALVFGQAAGQAPPPPETTAPDIPGVVKGGTKVRLIKAGFQGTEGPIAAPDGSVLFTEQNVNRIVRIEKDDKISTYVEDTKRTVGLGYDPKGRLLGAAQEGYILVLAPTRGVLAEKFAGQRLSRPNDLAVDRKGGVYFTDPIPTAAQLAAVPAPGAPPLPPPPPGRKPAVFYIKPDGQLVMATDGVERPNGVTLSKDERILYVTNREFIVAFDVQPDGSLRNQRTFVELVGLSKAPDGAPMGGADGIIIDDADRLYASTGPGVQVFSPQGKHLGTIPIPLAPQNIAFAGADRKTLYVVGRGAAYKVAMQAQGIKDRGGR
jgi:gluconolactonase